MKCLVTGFEAVEGVNENPTEKIARELPKTLAGVALEVEILPVEYGIVDRVLAKPRHRDVAGVFMLGAAGEAEFGRLEVQAFNWKSSSVSDNSGNLEQGQIISPPTSCKPHFNNTRRYRCVITLGSRIGHALEALGRPWTLRVQ